MRALIIVGLLALAGCAITANRDAGAMRGQPISAALTRYGYPASEQVIAGRHIYRWERSNQMFRCELVVEVDAAGRIVNHTMEGQLGACNRF